MVVGAGGCGCHWDGVGWGEVGTKGGVGWRGHIYIYSVVGCHGHINIFGCHGHLTYIHIYYIIYIYSQISQYNGCIGHAFLNSMAGTANHFKMLAQDGSSSISGIDRCSQTPTGRNQPSVDTRLLRAYSL